MSPESNPKVGPHVEDSGGMQHPSGKLVYYSMGAPMYGAEILFKQPKASPPSRSKVVATAFHRVESKMTVPKHPKWSPESRKCEPRDSPITSLGRRRVRHRFFVDFRVRSGTPNDDFFNLFRTQCVQF